MKPNRKSFVGVVVILVAVVLVILMTRWSNQPQILCCHEKQTKKTTKGRRLHHRGTAGTKTSEGLPQSAGPAGRDRP